MRSTLSRRCGVRFDGCGNNQRVVLVPQSERVALPVEQESGMTRPRCRGASCLPRLSAFVTLSCIRSRNLCSMDDAPILICYDDSPESRHAVDIAARLFPGRDAVILDVAPF